MPKVELSLVQEMLQKTKAEVEKMPTVNVMVVGKTGVGKSTLINSLFREEMATTGIGEPVTKSITRITKPFVPLVLYDTRGLELEQDVQETVQEQVMTTISQKKNTPEAIHVVYYCIAAHANRIEKTEIEWIRSLTQHTKVIVVLTQSIGTQAEEFCHYIKNLQLPVAAVLNVMAQPYPIYNHVTIPVSGLSELVEKTFQLVPKDSHEALANVQQIDVAYKSRYARKWVQRYVATTFGIGFSPIPFSDATLIVPMQISMLAHITAIFGVDFDKATLTTFISVLGGTTASTMVGRGIVTNLLKLVPGVGTITGGLISGTTASMITLALGLSYIEVLSYKIRQDQKGIHTDVHFLAELLREKIRGRLQKNSKTIKTEDTTIKIQPRIQPKPTIQQGVRNLLHKAKHLLQKK